MKKYIILAALCLFMAVLMAQTGLYDLSYAQDMAEAHKALLAKGFQESNRNDLSVTYTNDQIPGLIYLEIRDVLDTKTISSWTVRFDVEDNAGMIQKLIADLTAIHKKEPVTSDFDDRWEWDLGSTYGVNMLLYEEQSTLSVNYTNANEHWD
ncbi:MAG: hypothetical protein PHR32_05435 [Candidatus Cloacimonetes bacterium]|nr:hypothetical protein [Candidatus Cloacimonadota bacterium]